MDPLTATVIGKALDFLFDEVKAIIKERRARQVDHPTSQTEATELGQERPPSGHETTKQEVLQWELSQVVFQQREREIRSLVNQLTTHRENLNRAYEQAAKWGDALLPPIIANTIEDEERKIFEKSLRLKHALEKMYDRTINVEIPAPK